MSAFAFPVCASKPPPENPGIGEIIDGFEFSCDFAYIFSSHPNSILNRRPPGLRCTQPRNPSFATERKEHRPRRNFQTSLRSRDDLPLECSAAHKRPPACASLPDVQ